MTREQIESEGGFVDQQPQIFIEAPLDLGLRQHHGHSGATYSEGQAVPVGKLTENGVEVNILETKNDPVHTHANESPVYERDGVTVHASFLEGTFR